jgi:hypothetical protein
MRAYRRDAQQFPQPPETDPSGSIEQYSQGLNTYWSAAFEGSGKVTPTFFAPVPLELPHETILYKRSAATLLASKFHLALSVYYQYLIINLS